jgi:hypothetical protein
MAKERGQADREAGKSMRHWGWPCFKSRDAMVCPKCHTKIYPAGKKGTPDFPAVFIPLWDKQEIFLIGVEVKAGASSWPLNKLASEQRDWASEHPDRPLYIWLCLGDRIGSTKRPRRTWLFPFELFQEIESELLGRGRKSIPYDYERLGEWELEWTGKGLWELPLRHPLMDIWSK